MDNSNNPNYSNPLPSNIGPNPNPNFPQTPNQPPAPAADNSQTTNIAGGTYQPSSLTPLSPTPTPSPAPPSSGEVPTWPSTPLPVTAPGIDSPTTPPDTASPLATSYQTPIESLSQTFPSNFASPSSDYSTQTPPISPIPPNIPSTLPEPSSPPLQTPPISMTQEPAQQPPTAFTPSIPTPTPTFSPLDNPWGAPTQPPTIDIPAMPTISQPPPIQPSWMNVGANASPPLPSTTESAPTDLSHLITNNSQPEIPIAPETLVVSPQIPAAETPPVGAEGPKGLPKWVIGLGIGLLIIVAGASAYFILGIGQPPKTTASLPAETAKAPLPQVKPPAPIATPFQPEPASSGSANFGQLQGGGQSATSAADLINQRQQIR